MVILDIETAPIADAGQYLEPVSAPSNYKDEEKKRAYCEDAQRQALAKASLDVDLCRVVALGVWNESSAEPRVERATDELAERVLLADLWAYIGTSAIVGYNVLDFDLPVLLRRCLYLNVEAPRLEIGKYRHPRVTDLMQVLSYDGKLKYRGLDFYCKRFNLVAPVELGDDDLPAAEIGVAVERGEWERIVRHCRIDVWKTRALAERINVMASVETAF